ncbi:(4Fe-4S)-binding protein [Chitinophaga sp. OAE865]|uniref:(4Fe-4S)-binding protein n=1 Tax=Chitinophaga sp. OAE865 TaxID=2817898 RepID=UPI001AEAD514
MKDIIKHYTNGEVTIVWKPGVCIHSEKCFHGLPAVFNPGQKPWINAEAATTEQIISQVKQCPSGALSFFMNSDEAQQGGME